MVDLGLVVVRAEAGAAVVAEREPGRGCPVDRPEALGADLAQQVGGGEAVHAAGGVVPDLVRGVVDEHEHRAAARTNAERSHCSHCDPRHVQG
jgi:hypothetical protein